MPVRRPRPKAPPRPPAADPVARDLARLRRRIDALNDQLVRLLNERTGVCLRVGALKRAAGVPLRVPAREQEVLRQVRGAATGPLPPRAVERIFRAIIAETLGAETRVGAARPRPPAP